MLAHIIGVQSLNLQHTRHCGCVVFFQTMKPVFTFQTMRCDINAWQGHLTTHTARYLYLIYHCSRVPSDKPGHHLAGLQYRTMVFLLANDLIAYLSVTPRGSSKATSLSKLLPRPVTTIVNDHTIWSSLNSLVLPEAKSVMRTSLIAYDK